MKNQYQQAFLLTDAIFAIAVTALCLFSLSNLLLCTKSMQKSSFHKNEIVYSYVQFDNFLHNEKRVYTQPTESSFKRAVFTKTFQNGSQKTYRIEQYRNLVRVTTTKGGHMPLLLNVQRATFVTGKQNIIIHVIEKSGKKSDLHFMLDKKEIKEEKSVAKKD